MPLSLRDPNDALVFMGDHTKHKIPIAIKYRVFKPAILNAFVGEQAIGQKLLQDSIRGRGQPPQLGGSNKSIWPGATATGRQAPPLCVGQTERLGHFIKPLKQGSSCPFDRDACDGKVVCPMVFTPSRQLPRRDAFIIVGVNA